MAEDSVLEELFAGHGGLLDRLTKAFSDDESLRDKLNEAAKQALGRMENREDDFYTDSYDCAGKYIEAVRGTEHEEGLWKVLGNYLGAYELLKGYMDQMGAAHIALSIERNHEGGSAAFARGNIHHVYEKVEPQASRQAGLDTEILMYATIKPKEGISLELCRPMIALLAKRRDELLRFFEPLIPDLEKREGAEAEFLSNISKAIKYEYNKI